MNFPAKPKKVAYVVIRGRIPGIYDQWWEAKKQIHEFVGACFKGYETYEEAIDVWNAWEQDGVNLIAKKHVRTKSGKPNRKAEVEARDRGKRLEVYARQIIREHSGPDGSGSHSYIVP